MKINLVQPGGACVTINLTMTALPQDGAAPDSTAVEPVPSSSTDLGEGGEDLTQGPNFDTDGGDEGLIHGLNSDLYHRVIGRSDFRRRAVIFIEEYLTDLNAARAARVAWPNALSRCTVRGFWCLHQPNIKAIIDEELAKRRKARGADNATVMNNLLCIAYDDTIKPDARVRASEIILKVNGAFRDEAAQVNIMVGLADRLSEAKTQLEGESK
jgi:hypothetical protein